MSQDELRTNARNPNGTRKWKDTGRQVRANRPGAACVTACGGSENQSRVAHLSAPA